MSKFICFFILFVNVNVKFIWLKHTISNIGGPWGAGGMCASFFIAPKLFVPVFHTPRLIQIFALIRSTFTLSLCGNPDSASE